MDTRTGRNLRVPKSVSVGLGENTYSSGSEFLLFNDRGSVSLYVNLGLQVVIPVPESKGKTGRPIRGACRDCIDRGCPPDSHPLKAFHDYFCPDHDHHDPVHSK